MTRRQWFNLILLVLIYPINELHTEFKHSGMQFINHWIKEGFDYNLSTQWYVKFLCLDISNVLKAWVVFRLARMNQVVRTVSGVYLALTILDLFFFFYDCNTGNYLLLYSFTGLFAVLIAYPKRNYTKQKYFKNIQIINHHDN